MMLQQNQFSNITHLFYSGEYQQGQRQITKVINRELNNSNLFVNRALFLSQLDRDQEAIRDLEKALNINPRNYIAYFNLFSILTKMEEDEQAFSNLCCSLSCMYLIRAKINKSLDDADIAISYSNNNFEAFVLRGLIFLQKQQYQDAKNSFKRAEYINPHHHQIRRLKQFAKERGPIQTDFGTFLPKGEINFRLKGTYKSIDGTDLIDEIDNKLAEFNKLYIDINSNAGAVTQKVPNGSGLSIRNSQMRSSRHEDVKVIFDSGLSTPIKRSELHPEPGNVYILSSILGQNYQNQHKSFHSCKNEVEQYPQESFVSIINHNQEVYEEKLLEHSIIANKYEEKPVSFESHFSSVFESERPLEQNLEVFESVISQLKLVELPIEQKQEEQIQSEPTEHYNIIYPLDEHMKLKIYVLNLEFFDGEQELLNKLTDVYCIINYNNGKSKMKTMAKPCQEEVCVWNQQFDPIDISQNPSDMKIKIYNKKYTSVRDEFLGDLEVLITTADLLKLPVFNKKGLLGNLLLHLQLVERTPTPIPKTEQQQGQLAL